MNSLLQLGYKSCLISSSFAVSQSRLRIATLVSFRTSVMASQRASVSQASPKATTDGKRKVSNLKRPRGTNSNSDENVVEENDSKVDMKMFKDDPSRIDALTVQELRTTLKSIGIPAKGRKDDLVTALRSFVEKKTIGLSSQFMDQESSISINGVQGNQKAKHLSNTDGGEDLVDAVEDYGARQTKRLPKVLASESKTVKTETKISKTKKKQTVKSEEISNAATSIKQSRTKRKVSSEVCSITEHEGGVQVVENEPWTVLAHKRPEKGWIPYNPRTMRPSPLTKDIKFVKILSWNVNGLRALLKVGGFSALKLAEREDFDVLCLQETKLQEKDIQEITKSLVDGYDNCFWTCSVSKLGYSGTAIISRIKPLSVRYGLGVPEHDGEGRLVTVEFDSYYLLSGYVPNSGDGLKRLSYRITEWDPTLSNYMKELEKTKPVVLTGDLNCAHQEIDINNPVGNRRSAGFTDEERESFGTNFLSKGFVDTFRQQHANAVGYTYWGYRHGGRKTNKGWRLDYFLVSESIAEKVHDSYILPDVGGSDHCPIGLVLKL